MKPISIMLLLFLMLLGNASGQTSTSLEPKTYTERMPPVQKANRTFNVEVSYVLNDMIADQHVKFTVTITAPKAGNDFLELRGLPVITSRDAVDKFQFTSNGMEDFKEELVQRRNYYYIVAVDKTAEARRHQVRVDFAYTGEPNEDAALRHFDLYVGVNKGGKLEPVPPAEGTQPPSFEAGLIGKRTHKYNLNLRNSFPDYTVKIESIKLESEPGGWIVPVEFSPTSAILIPPSGEETIPIDLQTEPLGIRNLLKGFTTTPRIKANIIYNDGNARRITDFKPLLPVSILPTNQLLLGSVFLGLLIGAGFRALLEFMLFKKRITRRGLIKVVSYSLAFGLLLVILAAAGQIEIKAKTFSVSSSYDNPLTLLVIGLIGALAGLQMIIGWYKSLKVD